MDENGSYFSDLLVELPEELGMPEGFPEDWKIVRLGQLVDDHKLWIQNGFAQGSYNQTGYGIPHLRPFNISDDGNLDFSQIKYVPEPANNSPYWLKSGDLIFNNTNSEELVGKTAYFFSDRKCVLSNHMTIIRVLDKEYIDAYWLAKQLHYLWYLGFFKAICRRHVNQASISLARLREVTILFPPFPEQRAIACVLLAVQQAKEATEQVIQATRGLKKSLLCHLFTYGPVPVEEAEKVPLKETEIGLVPEHWEMVRLGDIALIRGGISFPPEFQGVTKGEYPFFKVSDMNLPGNEKVMFAANNYITEQIKKTLGANPFPAGTVIFPKVGGALHTNKKRILQRLSLIDNNLMGITIIENRCSSDFLFHWFETVNLSDFCNPGPLPSINAMRIKNQGFPLPPLPEQREIARILETVDKKLQAEEARKQALETLFKTLLHHLMTGKVRVKPSENVEEIEGIIE
ncbi:MAG: restriction endonuclease subunit S [Firmicutes bacterium]|nr:restriction endonuclease subunit S [Bacillota bacterium]